MKKIGEYTCRGVLNQIDTNKRIQLFDGKFDTAYKVKEFYIWPSTFSSTTTADIVGKLATEGDVNSGAVNFFDANDNREIAWAGTGSDAIDTWMGSQNAIIDPDNMIVQDLYVFARGLIDLADVCYMVVLEKFKVDDWKALIAMVRNKGQNNP